MQQKNTDDQINSQSDLKTSENQKGITMLQC